MNEKYHEAAEHAAANAKFHDCLTCDLAATILSKLAAGEWVLCEKVTHVADNTHGEPIAVGYEYAPVELP